MTSGGVSVAFGTRVLVADTFSAAGCKVGATMDCTCSGVSGRIGIWSIWMPGRPIELVITAHVLLLRSFCGAAGRIVLLVERYHRGKLLS